MKDNKLWVDRVRLHCNGIFCILNARMKIRNGSRIFYKKIKLNRYIIYCEYNTQYKSLSVSFSLPGVWNGRNDKLISVSELDDLRMLVENALKEHITLDGEVLPTGFVGHMKISYIEVTHDYYGYTDAEYQTLIRILSRFNIRQKVKTVYCKDGIYTGIIFKNASNQIKIYDKRAEQHKKRITENTDTLYRCEYTFSTPASVNRHFGDIYFNDLSKIDFSSCFYELLAKNELLNNIIEKKDYYSKLVFAIKSKKILLNIMDYADYINDTEYDFDKKYEHYRLLLRKETQKRNIHILYREDDEPCLQLDDRTQ